MGKMPKKDKKVKTIDEAVMDVSISEPEETKLECDSSTVSKKKKKKKNKFENLEDSVTESLDMSCDDDTAIQENESKIEAKEEISVEETVIKSKKKKKKNKNTDVSDEKSLGVSCNDDSAMLVEGEEEAKVEEMEKKDGTTVDTNSVEGTATPSKKKTKSKKAKSGSNDVQESVVNGASEAILGELKVSNGLGTPATENKRSIVRDSMARMKEDSTYIGNFMKAIHIPQHRTNDVDDVSIDEIPEEAKERLLLGKKGKGRAVSKAELQQRLQKRLEELRGTKLGANESKRLKKTKRKIAALEKKKAGGDDLKQKLMKIGNQSGGKAVLKNAELAGAKVSKPGVKTEKGMVYSKFDFQGEEAVKETKKTLDPQAALRKLQKNKEKIKMWEEKGKTDKAKNIENNIAWDNALGKAQGEKIKDDEFLLKKSIKKQQQMKKSKLKKWENRVENVESKKDEKQKKRGDNLSKKKKDKKDKKMKHLEAKGRNIPVS